MTQKGMDTDWGGKVADYGKKGHKGTMCQDKELDSISRKQSYNFGQDLLFFLLKLVRDKQ